MVLLICLIVLACLVLLVHCWRATLIVLGTLAALVIGLDAFGRGATRHQSASYYSPVSYASAPRIVSDPSSKADAIVRQAKAAEKARKAH